MIELNLIEKKKPIRLPNVLGVDLNLINFKMMVFAIILFYIPDMFVRSYFEEILTNKNADLQTIKTRQGKIQRDITKNSNVKNLLDAYTLQVEKLKARSSQVDEVLKIRTNPKKVLEKIARSIPEELWFDQLKIDSNKDILISGGSYSSRSIGQFLTAINDSPFFGNSLSPTKQENKQDSADSELGSHEIFELKGKIINYDMRSK